MFNAMTKEKLNVVKENHARPESYQPKVLILCGTSDIKNEFEKYRDQFADIDEIYSGNSRFANMLMGKLGGHLAAFATVCGPQMAYDVTDYFAVSGISLVILAGSCLALNRNIRPGDTLMAVEACRYERYAGYHPSSQFPVFPARWDSSQRPVGNGIPGRSWHWGRVCTVSNTVTDIEQISNICLLNQCWAVDRETAGVFAVAGLHHIDCTAILTVADNPVYAGGSGQAGHPGWYNWYGSSEKSMEAALQITYSYCECGKEED